MATHIKSIISEFLKDRKGEANNKVSIERIINKNLDRKLRKHICLQKIYKNKLIFCSDASSASYDFNLKKGNLLRAVKKEFPEIEDIKITIK